MAKVADRVRKILDRAKPGSGCTEDEMEQALETARKLMDEHRLSEEDIKSSDGKIRDREWVTVLMADADRRCQPHDAVLDVLASGGFGVTAFTQEFGGRTDYMVFGTPDATEVARCVFNFLRIRFTQLWRAKSTAEDWPVNMKDDYMMGLAAGLIQKLQSNQVKKTCAIMLYEDELAKAFRKTFTNIRKETTSGPKHLEAYRSGTQDGQGIHIAKQIGKGTEKGCIFAASQGHESRRS